MADQSAPDDPADAAPPLRVTYFTDPFCSWCWAMEPGLIRMRERWGHGLSFDVVMGGLVEDMADFYDARNDIDEASQVAPHWAEVSKQTGQPIDERLWHDVADPHFSTWPACVAAKAAFEQGPAAGLAYLRRMRRAALTERRNVSDRDVYFDLAEEVADAGRLDLASFEVVLADGSAQFAFQKDREECGQYGVTGFPALRFEVEGRDPVMLHGWRPPEFLDRVFEELVPDLEPAEPPGVDELLERHGPLTTKELAVVTEADDVDAMRAELEGRVKDGSLERIEVRNGELWALAP